MSNELNIALISGPAYEPLYECLESFTAATGIDVNVAFGGDHPTLNRHLATLRDVPYDLVSTHTKYAPSQLRVLAPLDDLLSAADIDDFVPLLLELASVEGALYGLPRNIDVRVLHYRKDLISRPPATWDELLEFARETNVPSHRYGFLFPGRDSGLFGTFYELAEMAGARLFPPTLVPEIENDGGRWALRLLTTLYAEGLVPGDLPDWHYDRVHECFRAGRATMVGDWPGYYSLYRDPQLSRIHDVFGLSPYPVGPSGTSLAYGGGHTFALTRRGADKPAALDLLMFLTSYDQQLFEARCGCVPVRRSVMWQMQAEADDPDRVRLSMLEEVVAEHILIPPKFAQYPEVEDVLWRTVQRAITGELETDEALEHMTEQIGAIVQGEEAALSPGGRLSRSLE